MTNKRAHEIDLRGSVARKKSRYPSETLAAKSSNAPSIAVSKYGEVAGIKRDNFICLKGSQTINVLRASSGDSEIIIDWGRAIKQSPFATVVCATQLGGLTPVKKLNVIQDKQVSG